MKKAIVQGKALMRVILPVLLLVFGLQWLGAQTSLSSSTPLTNKAVMAELMNANLMTESEAIDVLSFTYKDMIENADQNMTTAEEVELGVRAEYYEYLLGELLAGGGLNDILTQSVVELQAIIARYKVAPDPLLIFQQTVALLSQ